MSHKELPTAALLATAIFLASCSQVHLPQPNSSTRTDFSEGLWPQWRGPERTGLSTETGLLRQWPADGPSLVWSTSDLGEGYGSVAIQGGRIFVQGTLDNDSTLFCLEESSGRTLWTASLGDRLEHGRGPGPRGTPTIDEDRIYVLTENGDLACLQAADGQTLWHRNILKDFKGENPKWLISESPLVDGNRLIVMPGGDQASLVALDKDTGKTIWTSKDLSDGAGYSSCVVADVHGIRTLLAFTAAAAVGLRAGDGQLLWRYEPVANRTANVATPVVYRDKAFYSSAYGTGCALLQLKADNGSMEAKEVYFNRDMNEPPRRGGSGRRLSLRILERHPHLHGIRDRKGDVEGPERGQGIGGLCRRPPLPVQRKERGGPGRSHDRRVPGERALRSGRPGLAQLGPPRGERRQTLHPQPGRAQLL